MNNPLQKLHTAARHINLSHDEKARMRAKIFEAIDAPKYAPAPRARVVGGYSWFSVRFAVPLALLLVVALGGSTAYAAQGALPGGILYPVKVYVNEGVAGALAVSDEAKLSYHASVAQTRLKEAEELASEGKLDATTSAQIEANLSQHIAQADTIAAKLEETDPAAGVEAAVNLDSSLSAHGSVLARLGDGSSDEATKENSNAIAFNIRSRHMGRGEGEASAAKAAVPQMRTMALSAADTSTSSGEATSAASTYATSKTKEDISATSDTRASSQEKVALQLQKKATSTISDAQDEYDNAKRSLSTTTAAKVEAQLADLSARMGIGNAQVESEDYDAARESFTDIIQDAVELSTFIDASKTYKKDFVRLWWGRSDNDDMRDNGGDNDDSAHGQDDDSSWSHGQDGGDSSNNSDKGVRVDVHF